VQASEVFSRYVEAPPEEKQKHLQILRQRFAHTPYYPRALFLTAQSQPDEAAIRLLQEVRQKSKDTDLYDVATLNLAARLGTTRQQEALSLLEQGKTQAFRPFFLELKADMLVRAKDFAGARKAYEAALATKKFSENYALMVERKLSRAPL
jgi:predicted negative regulator of RcsB-dependent stress response